MEPHLGRSVTSLIEVLEDGMSKKMERTQKEDCTTKPQLPLTDVTYPAGMEAERKEPALGDEKAGPRNPKPLLNKTT